MIFWRFLAAKEWITTKWMEINYAYLRTGTAIGFRASRELCSNYLYLFLKTISSGKWLDHVLGRENGRSYAVVFCEKLRAIYKQNRNFFYAVDFFPHFMPGCVRRVNLAPVAEDGDAEGASWSWHQWDVSPQVSVRVVPFHQAQVRPAVVTTHRVQGTTQRRRACSITTIMPSSLSYLYPVYTMKLARRAGSS